MKRIDQLAGFRRLTEKELSVRIVESQKNLLAKHQEKLLGKLKNTAQIKSQKKEIARMKTVLDEKITANVAQYSNEQN